MMWNRRSAVGVAFAVLAASTPFSAAMARHAPKMVAGEQSQPGVSYFDMASAISGRTYRIQIFRPSVAPPTGGYPVFYTTDAFGFFNQAADTMRARQYTDLKPAIIIGIGYPTADLWQNVRLRMRDLLPDRPNALFLPTFNQWVAPFHGSLEDSGGAEAFYQFINLELRPALGAMLPVDRSNQTLFGHSLGGLFALHVLFNHPEAFSTYAISSPSIAVNGRAVLAGESKLAGAFAAGKSLPRILLMCASEENYPSAALLAGMSAADAARQAQLGRMTDDVPELAARLKLLYGQSREAVAFKQFDGENHMSVTPASLSRAMSFALSTQPPPLRP